LSAARKRSGFSRARLFVGLLLVTLIGAGVVFALSRVRGGPDAGNVVYTSADGVFIHDLSSGRDRLAATLPKGTVAAIPSPDGKWVAYSRGAGELWLASLDSRRRFQVADQFVVPLGWSPDGRLLASELLSDRDLVLIDPDGGRDVVMSGGAPPTSYPVWLDEHRFALATGEGEFVLFDTIGPSQSDPGLGTPLAASPDGEELLFALRDKLLVAKIEGKKRGQLKTLFTGTAKHAAASTEGFLAIAGEDARGRSGAWVFQGGSKSTRVVSGTVDGLAWSAKGAALLYQRKGVIYAIAHSGTKPVRVSRRGVAVFRLQSFIVVP
jgi:hypothetical protein